MIRKLMMGATVAAVLFGSGVAYADPAAAVADASRPDADKDRDAARKPAEMLTFSHIKDGDTVLELLPGGGYFTRLLSKDVGPSGHLYAAVPDAMSRDASPAATLIAKEPGYGNITVIPIQPLPDLPPLDAIWTSQNYHDLHLSRVHADMASVDKGFYAALKPGGVVIIIDHAAIAGAPVAETADNLHRIDPAVVKAEMTAAGFILDGESDALWNPNDPHTDNVFAPTIRGKTDQFALRFKKPK
ncbi:MAG TPA: hypothetical protein VHL34_09200 [Rhizomicrobium sp.]|jgi:predicted methyltransferase|nr:hypothetical protein [Rhizomicrobium sp.]